jgi:Lar family restriction alleviation protein
MPKKLPSIDPCPFCGFETCEIRSEESMLGSVYFVRCFDCLTRGPLSGVSGTAFEKQKYVILKWNKRIR